MWTILHVLLGHVWMENVKFGLLKKVSSRHKNEAVKTQTEGGEFGGRMSYMIFDID